MIFKLKIKFLKFLNIILNLINLNIELSLKKDHLIKIFNKLQPYDLGYDLVRIGSDNDGGYLVPNILDEIKICFSPGTGKNVSFENDLINRGIETFLADGTIKESDIKLDNLNFVNKNLASYDSEKTTTLENWVQNKTKDANELLLQMDIESSEYETIHSTSQECLKKFKIIIIEFHYFEKINNYYFYKNFNNTLEKLLLNFEISHIHPNNCQGYYSVSGINLPTAIEVTFLRKDLCRYKRKIIKLPHKLDQRNINYLPDVFLPKEIIN